MWYLIVSIPDLCTLTYFERSYAFYTFINSHSPVSDPVTKGPFVSFGFDLVCDRLHGLIRACISDSLDFKVAFPFKVLIYKRY